jgi:hypothetical protein
MIALGLVRVEGRGCGGSGAPYLHIGRGARIGQGILGIFERNRAFTMSQSQGAGRQARASFCSSFVRERLYVKGGRRRCFAEQKNTNVTIQF